MTGSKFRLDRIWVVNLIGLGTRNVLLQIDCRFNRILILQSPVMDIVMI